MFHHRSVSVRLFHRVALAMVFLTGFWGMGCSDDSIRTGPSYRVIPRAHPTGTLLTDHEGGLWRVGAWPDRDRVTGEEAARTHLDTSVAIPMAPVEEICLRDSGIIWHGRELWELTRLPDGSYAYLDRARHLRRGTELMVIRAWGDDPDHAATWEMSMDVLLAEYRDLGLMPFPDGTLVRSEGRIWYLWSGEAHPFLTEELARIVGYDPTTRAIDVPMPVLERYVTIGFPLDIETFLICPYAAARVHGENDADGDGAPRSRDCDDEDPNRAPGREELCDGIDNDCDGVIDNGFAVGLPCTMENECRSPGVTACNFDRWSVSCQNEEAVCE